MCCELGQQLAVRSSSLRFGLLLLAIWRRRRKMLHDLKSASLSGDLVTGHTAFIKTKLLWQVCTEQKRKHLEHQALSKCRPGLPPTQVA